MYLITKPNYKQIYVKRNTKNQPLTYRHYNNCCTQSFAVIYWLISTCLNLPLTPEILAIQPANEVMMEHVSILKTVERAWMG